MNEPSIFLTSDDGIKSIGSHTFYGTPLELVDVTAVASAMDQSTVGRGISIDAVVVEHEFDHTLEGTPVGCTVVGLKALCPGTDMVVSGINKGANIGIYVLGRSGIVSAVIEAAFFDIPAIVLSLYVPAGGDLPRHEKATDPRSFREATSATSYLVKHTRPAGVFEQYDYLNVNVLVSGLDGGPADIQTTVPSELYNMTAEFENGTVEPHDRVWEWMGTGDTPSPDDIDRRTAVKGRASVSSLTAPHTTHRHEALGTLVEMYLE